MHELPSEKLKQREVVFIDIANDPVAPGDYKDDEDPTKFKSAKTGRGPLVGTNWKYNVKPVMTCYKLVTVEFKWFGLQVRASNLPLLLLLLLLSSVFVVDAGGKFHTEIGATIIHQFP